jgi:uncharacterized protein
MPTLPQAQAIDAPEVDYLYVRTSHIVGAGLGLFTVIPIHRGEVVAVYRGERFFDAEARLRASRGADAYFVTLVDGNTLDSMHSDCFARYANDVEGPATSPLRNNAVITMDDSGRPCVMAMRRIPAGGEVYVDYGKAYWTKRKV